MPALAVVVPVVSASAGMAGAHVAAAPPAITFATPMVMDPTHTVGEPTIVHSPASDNTVYASGPWGTGTQRSIWNASADGGETFRLVNQCAPQSGEVATECQPPSAVLGSPNPPGGGDTDQRLDHTGKDYFVDLWALACDRVAATSNRGASALQNAYGCDSPTVNPTSRPDGSDRPWLAEFDPHLTGVTSTAPDSGIAPLTYMEYNNLQTVQPNPAYWVKSTDGLNYSPANSDNGNFGSDGYPAVDQVTGKVFEASGCGNALCLNIGTPVDASGDLCFLDDPASITIGGTATTCPKSSGLITIATGLAGDPDLLFPVASMDSGRNLHVTFAVAGAVTGTTSTFQVFTTVASAASGWTTWASPAQVSQAPSNVNVFPWMVAGGPGRSDSVWYGTNSFVDPSTNGGQAWNVYMSQVVWPVNAQGGVTLAAPTVTMTKVSPHPNHYNSICLLGTGCITAQGDRNLADFFTVTIDHTGAAEVEYDDTSNGLIQQGFTPTSGLADHPGAPLVTIARQNGGPGLYGKRVSGLPHEPASVPASGMSDPSGDALYPVINGNNVRGLDLTSNQIGLSTSGALTVTMQVVDVSAGGVAAASLAVPGAQFLQYVTRWQMGNTIYYAMMETTPALAAAGQYNFYAGQAQSIDLCSVSACDPHVIYYPEAPAPGGHAETGSVSCPAVPAPRTPCTITVTVNGGDVGTPAPSSLLEEVGSYAFGAARPQAAVTNAQAEADELPLEVDGICCFNGR
ncbi:MAG TPA: hypothetical protein VF155_12450 [Candidatus Dormibacteraeota bacterium]